ncbi:hypothetical protein [Streptomyces jumonjinensis]|uniref:hypothetical protein n=1 Tax=Streptomyces jumonjinensis TaxID=1945 RepID=UPI003795C7F7
MDITPDSTADLRDQHIAVLRAALERAAAWLSFSAGIVAAKHPDYAERQMAGADGMKELLLRTAPEEGYSGASPH